MSDGLIRHAPRSRRLLACATALAVSGMLAVPPAAHAAARAHTQAPSVRNGSTLTQAQASAQAKTSGKPVAVPAATTSTHTLTANPDGSFTLTQSLTPVRKRVNGAWKSLDATLMRNPDGTLSPAVSTGGLILSGGGPGTLATMRNTSGASMAVSLPAGITLTTPHLSGDTATYPQVIPGVDLQVSADAQGGFSEVLIVQSAAAAADPRLSSLAFGIKTTGVAVSTDAAGNLTATDPAGRAVFTAPPARMWDSAAPAAGRAFTTNPTTGVRVDPPSGRPLSSTSDQPGVAAHTADLKAAYHGNTLTLTPDQGILTGHGTKYPVYLDPSYTDNPTDGGNYTYVSSMYPTTKYWGVTTTHAVGPLHAGYIDDTVDSPNYISVDRTYLRLPLDPVLDGATVQDSTLSITENYSYSCTASLLDLYTTGDISASTTWNTQPAQSTWTLQGQANTAHGWSSSNCPSSAIGFNLNSLIAADAASASPPNHLTFMLKGHTETDQNEWKQFYQTATLTTHYDRPPNTPGSLSTSGAPSCSAGGTPIGKGDVTLNANVSDPDGGTVYAFFTLKNATTGTTVASTSYQPATSGLFTSLTVPQATMIADSGTTSIATYTWSVYLKDGTASDANAQTSKTSSCSFRYDPTTPGPPTVKDANGVKCDPENNGVAYQIGQPASFTLTPNGSTTPSGYLYQLNGAAPLSTTTGSITVTPTRRANTLTVTAQSQGGNLGTSATCIFNATAATPAADKDLTGDGTPDLLTVGGTSTSLPPGLWQATGQTSGQVTPTAVNLGANGTATTATPSQFNATQAVTGRFADHGVQDILDYNPATGNAVILYGNGDGSTIQSQDSNNEQFVSASALTDGNNLYPLQLANAYNADTSNSASNTTYPDLIGTAGNTTGYYLDYYESANQTGSWLSVDGNADFGYARTITHNTPANDQNWATWTIATTQIGGTVDMYLWQPTTGALYLWTGVTVTDDANTLTATLAYTTQYTIDDGTSGHQWNRNPSPAATTLQAADINGDGTPDITLATTTGTTTAYLATQSGNTVTLAAQPVQTLITSSHAWTLGDYSTTTHTAGDDTAGTALNMTGTGGVSATTGDLFSPDITLDGTSASLSTASKAVDLAGSFTISAWAKPTALGGAVLAQGGSADVGMTLFAGTSGAWVFSLNTGAGTTNSYDTITGGTVQLGTWAHLTASFNAATSVMNLYVDDVFVATGSHTAPATGATGGFVVGFDGTRHFTGQIADARTWSATALAPAQPSSPASYHQAVAPARILDTRTSNVTLSSATASTPVAPMSVTTLKISGDAVTPIVTGAPTTIPASVTAVAIDVTETAPTEPGVIVAFADGTQVPITSSTNFLTGATVTGYQIVPVGPDGKIAIQNNSTGTTHLIVDITGYFTSGVTLTGDQTYIPLTSAYRLFDTAASTANTSLHATGPVPAGATFNVQIAGVDNIPATATGVAINLTAFSQTGGGFLEAYPTGSTQPTAFTSMTYGTTDVASMSADTTLGSSGQITLYNSGGSTDLIGDISGYYINSTSGQKYHAVNPTRLVDTRSGIGGTQGALAANGTYTLTQATTSQITTAATPTLVAMLTATDQTSTGNITAYPYGTTRPGTSNVNWSGDLAIANLALTPESTGGQITLYNQSAGTTSLVIDTSGYFATG